MKNLNLYEYTDYRKFLKDYYEFQKSKSSHGFSYRIFSQRAGLKSPNYYKMIMDGDRNLSTQMIHRFSTALNLNQKQQLFFEALVNFNQSNSPNDKDFYYQKMTSFKEHRESAKLSRDQYEYFSRWYYVTIRELIGLPNFKASTENIIEALQNKITAKQTNDAIQLLLDLKLIAQTENNLYEQAESKISTDHELGSLSAFNYHRQMIRLALDSLNLPAESREISAITMGVNKKNLAKLKRKLFEFLTKLQHNLEEEMQDEDAVYQLNFQLFPLVDIEDKDFSSE